MNENTIANLFSVHYSLGNISKLKTKWMPHANAKTFSFLR